DRERFGAAMTRAVAEHPLIELVAAEVERIPDERPCVVATGPLTGDSLAADLVARIGKGALAYYDAIAPIVSGDSLDWDKLFFASRWDKGQDDEDRAAYANSPLDEAGYRAFVAALCAAEKLEAHSFEDVRYFEG